MIPKYIHKPRFMKSVHRSMNFQSKTIDGHDKHGCLTESSSEARLLTKTCGSSNAHKSLRKLKCTQKPAEAQMHTKACGSCCFRPASLKESSQCLPGSSSPMREFPQRSWSSPEAAHGKGLVLRHGSRWVFPGR